MLNIIIGILLIRLLIDIILKNNPMQIMACGLWGYYSKNANKFEWAKFDWIGVKNDPRGGDACGRVYGEFYDHTNETPEHKYEGFIKRNLPQRKNPNAKAVFGHTRKASFVHTGKKGNEYTQPIVFFDDENNIEYIFSHNGTLYNHEELAEKYGLSKGIDSFKYINTDGEEKFVKFNDSQILGWILGHKKDFSVLKEYKGSAAFSLYDYKEDKLYLWSGASLSSSVAKYATEERPLNVLQSKDHLWFSSEFDPLQLINYNEKDEVDSLENNILYIYQEGVLIDQQHFDRSESYQYNKTEPTQTYRTRETKRERKERKRRERQFERAVDNNEVSSSSKYIQCFTCDCTGFVYGNVQCPDCKGDGYLPRPPLSLPMGHKELFGEKVPSKKEMIIHYAQGIYYLKGKPAHGIIHLNGYGMAEEKAITAKKADNMWQVTKPYYFILGNMLQDHLSFSEWSRTVNSKSKLTETLIINMKEHCVYPILNLEKDRMKINKSIGYFNYTGKFNPLFSHYNYSFYNGLLEKKESISGMNYPKHYDLTPIQTKKMEINTLPFDDDGDIKNSDGLDVIPDGFDESLDEQYNDTIKRELSEELAHVLKAYQAVQAATYAYTQNKIAQKVDEMVEQHKRELENLDL